MSFLVADRNWPWASNGSAACAFWAAVSDFWTPNQVKPTRTAAMVVRSRWAAVAVVVASVWASARSRRLAVLIGGKLRGETWGRGTRGAGGGGERSPPPASLWDVTRGSGQLAEGSLRSTLRPGLGVAPAAR